MSTAAFLLLDEKTRQLVGLAEGALQEIETPALHRTLDVA